MLQSCRLGSEAHPHPQACFHRPCRHPLTALQSQEELVVYLGAMMLTFHNPSEEATFIQQKVSEALMLKNKQVTLQY